MGVQGFFIYNSIIMILKKKFFFLYFVLVVNFHHPYSLQWGDFFSKIGEGSDTIAAFGNWNFFSSKNVIKKDSNKNPLDNFMDSLNIKQRFINTVIAWGNGTKLFFDKIHNSFLSNTGISFLYLNFFNNNGKNLNQEFFKNNFFINGGAGGEIFSLYDDFSNVNIDKAKNNNRFYNQYLSGFLVFNLLKKTIENLPAEEEEASVKFVDKVKLFFLNIFAKSSKYVLENLFIKLGLCWKMASFQYNRDTHDQTDLLKFFPLHYLSLLLPLSSLKNSYQRTFHVYLYFSFDYKLFAFKSIYTFLSMKFINGRSYLSINLSYVNEKIHDIQTYTYYQQCKNDEDEKQRKEETRKFAQFDAMIY